MSTDTVTPPNPASAAASALVRTRWARRAGTRTGTCKGCGRQYTGYPEQEYCTRLCQRAAGARRQRARKRRAVDSVKDSVDSVTNANNGA